MSLTLDYDVFDRISKMIFEMSPEYREQWLKENTEEIETDFGVIVITKWPPWIRKEVPSEPGDGINVSSTK